MLKQFGARFGALAAAAVVMFAILATLSGAASAKALSQSKVSVYASAGGDNVFTYIAVKRGIFKKNGLDVDLITQDSGTANNSTAELASGSLAFGSLTITSGIAAYDQHVPLVTVFQNDIGAPNILSISTKTAKADGIPLSGSATAQFEALRKVHLQVGTIVSPDDATYLMASGLCKLYKVTCGYNDSSANLDFVNTSSVTTLDAGFKAGKYPALMTIPPFSLESGTVAIPLEQIPPYDNTAMFMVDAGTKFIKEHPDTVQAYVTSLVEAWVWAKAHMSQTSKYFYDLQALDGTSDKSLVAKDFALTAPAWKTPYMVKQAYENTIDLAKAAGLKSIPLTEPFSSWADTKFVDTAIKQLGLTKVINTVPAFSKNPSAS